MGHDYRDFSEMDIDDSWTFDIPRSETSYASHDYHRYPAKFIPQIPQRLILEYSKARDVVLDPFMGSGTTIVEAVLQGRKAYGTDINPVCELITRVKITPIEPTYLKQEITTHLELLAEILRNPDEALTDMELIDDLDRDSLTENERIVYWYPEKSTRQELASILTYIDGITDDAIRDFMQCALSNTLKNSSIWLMRSTKPTRNKNKQPKSPLNYLKRHLSKMLRGNVILFEKAPMQMRDQVIESVDLQIASSTNLPFDDATVQLIVTSPPYVTSYEYADLHQLSTLWLNYAEDYRDLRLDFIGSMFRELDDHLERIEVLIRKLSSPQAITTIRAFANTREQLPTAAYFYDMQITFEECYRVLKPSGHLAVVIGNTSIKGVHIKNAEIFIEMLEAIGFDITDVIKRKIPAKILPQTRDKNTGRFTSASKADRLAYPHEFILIVSKLK